MSRKVEPVDVRWGTSAILQSISALMKKHVGIGFIVVAERGKAWVQLDPVLSGGKPMLCRMIQTTDAGARQCRMCHVLMAVAAAGKGVREHRCHAGATTLAYPLHKGKGNGLVVLSSCVFPGESHVAREVAERRAARLGLDADAMTAALRALPALAPDKHALLLDLLRLAGEAALLVLDGEQTKNQLRAFRSEQDVASRKKGLPIQMLREAMMQSHELPRLPHASDGDGRKAPLVIRIIADLIVRNSHLPFALGDVAAVAKMTPTHLSALFRKHMGTNFATLLTDARIENAKKLLSDVTLNVGEVARTTGFDDAGYFARRFKQKTGLTPRAWREANGRVTEGIA